MGEQTNPDPNSAARSMADIARLFLDGARPLDEVRPTPKRLSPKDRQSSPPAPAPASPLAPMEYPANAAPTSTFLLAITGENEPRSWQLARAAALSLAHDQEVVVALIGARDGSLHIETSQIIEGLRVGSSGGPADVQLARTLFAAKNQIDHWIILRPANPADAAALSQAIPEWLLLSGTANDAVVNSYKALKAATMSVAPAGSAGPLTQHVSLFLHASDFAEAAAVHNRFRHACQGFLNTTDLQLAGVATLETGLHAVGAFTTSSLATLFDALLDFIADTQSADAETSESDVELGELPNAGIEAALYQAEQSAEEVATLQADAAAIAAATIDHLANVLDPAERDALAHVGFEEDESESQTPIAPSAPRGEFDIRKEVHAPTPNALRAIDIGAPNPDVSSQWQAVLRALPDLLPGVERLTVSARSFPVHATLVRDQQGIHLWILAADALSLLAAQQHAQELTAVYGQLPVITHVVCPLGTPRPRGLLGSDTLFLYQLHEITLHGHHGLIVVPA